VAAGAGILPRADGTSIAYHRTRGNSPGVVFLHGYRSDMTGGKALALEAYCQSRGYAFLRFDTWGHGASPGDAAQGTIGRWTDDAVAALDALTEGPQVLVGSSMGGWIALLAALERRDRIAGLVGIAAAPDFTEDLMWATFTALQRQDLLEKGAVLVADPMNPGAEWPIRRALIEDGRNRLLLCDLINLTCPVRLIHGQKDADVPWRTSLKLAECLIGDDVEVLLVKNGDHRMSQPQDLERLCRVVGEVVEKASR